MKDFNPNIHEEKIKAIARIIHDTEGKKEWMLFHIYQTQRNLAKTHL
jgi:hypothetical protein